jgi:hypothetical protein
MRPLPSIVARRPRGVLTTTLLLSILASCFPGVHRTLEQAPTRFHTDSLAPYLKVHLASGDLVLFSTWSADSVARRISGRATRYDINRIATSAIDAVIPYDSILLFESNRVVKDRGLGLGIVTGASLGVTAACALNPKACFGSCPTIYVGDGPAARLEAESFSSSVARSLAATDVDALPSLTAVRGVATIHIRNEALETHHLHSVSLLAVPHPRGTQVFATDAGAVWLAERTVAPVRCAAAEGSCLEALRARGGAERSVRVDSTDLAARETIELRFPATSAPRLGLVLRSRQSLVSTFLFYQTLAYLGRGAGRWLASLDRGDSVAHRQARLASEALGPIEVQWPDGAGGWRTVASTAEHGPLAADVRVLPLPVRAAGDSGPVAVRLRLARGAWRIDQAALAELVAPAAVVRLAPDDVARETRVGAAGVRRDADPGALALLRDSTRYLATYPGDGYAVSWKVPPLPRGETMSYFVSVRGFYLEWLRQEWQADENPLAAAALLADPARAMRTLAPRFSQLEPTMEAAFWGSRHALR